MLDYNRKKCDEYSRKTERPNGCFALLLICILAYSAAILWILGILGGRAESVRHSRTFPCVNVSSTSCVPVNTGKQSTMVKFQSRDAGGTYGLS